MREKERERGRESERETERERDSEIVRERDIKRKIDNVGICVCVCGYVCVCMTTNPVIFHGQRPTNIHYRIVTTLCDCMEHWTGESKTPLLRAHAALAGVTQYWYGYG